MTDSGRSCWRFTLAGILALNPHRQAPAQPIRAEDLVQSLEDGLENENYLLKIFEALPEDDYRTDYLHAQRAPGAAGKYEIFIDVRPSENRQKLSALCNLRGQAIAEARMSGTKLKTTTDMDERARLIESIGIQHRRIVVYETAIREMGRMFGFRAPCPTTTAKSEEVLGEGWLERVPLDLEATLPVSEAIPLRQHFEKVFQKAVVPVIGGLFLWVPQGSVMMTPCLSKETLDRRRMSELREYIQRLKGQRKKEDWHSVDERDNLRRQAMFGERERRLTLPPLPSTGRKP